MIHWAVRGGNIAAVKYFLESGAEINQTTKIGFTVLHEAAATNNVSLVEWLLEETDIDFRIKDHKVHLYDNFCAQSIQQFVLIGQNCS